MTDWDSRQAAETGHTQAAHQSALADEAIGALAAYAIGCGRPLTYDAPEPVVAEWLTRSERVAELIREIAGWHNLPLPF